MDFKILNVYNNEALPGMDLKSGGGESFLISVGDKSVLFDTGQRGGKLMHNMNRLRVNVDKVDKLVLSHGHRDHTGGLRAFLEARNTSTPIQVIAHPAALEPKSVKIFYFLQLPVGLPRLEKSLKGKLEFQLTKESTEVLPRLYTTGEVSLVERTEKPGIASGALHEVNGKREWDPVIDDLSLVLRTRDGLVIITGCCHAGLLNTCAKATRLFNDKINTVLGGIHTLEYSKEEVDHVGDVLEKVYGTPQLYLNHCTGEDAIQQLRNKFGSEIVHDCQVGTEVDFKT